MAATDDSDAADGLPAHIENTVRAIADMHRAHAAEATRSQDAVERVIGRAGTPAFVGLLTFLVFAWIAVNLGMLVAGVRPLDAPPFPGLQGVIALAALYTALLILTAQRRADGLTGHREQLTLELAILSEQKSAKIIALIEELRRDDPSISNRSDAHADELATPTDPVAVADALKVNQAAAETQ
jgi:uncharacterized membrane protein